MPYTRFRGATTPPFVGNVMLGKLAGIQKAAESLSRAAFSPLFLNETKLMERNVNVIVVLNTVVFARITLLEGL